MIKLNKQQQEFLNDAIRFIESDEKYYVLSGQAGVGKTTCIKYLLPLIFKKNANSRIALSAPTNKATKVLRQTAFNDKVTFKTIYSLLGLRMEASGALKELFDSGKMDIGSFDIVFIDEGSMINKELLDILDTKIRLSHTKIIIIGDKEQLPPVKDQVSPIWNLYKTNFELSEVMRHQSGILSFVQSIRGKNTPVFKEFGTDVSILDESNFMNKLEEHASKGYFHTGKSKAIAWRNITVRTLNELIRNSFTETVSKNMWVQKDRIIMLQPVMRDKAMLASVDDEGVIDKVSIQRHLTYPQFKVYKIDVTLEDDSYPITLQVLHEDSFEDLQEYLDSLSSKKLWGQFWKVKDAFNTIDHAYAITSHRSQGSTFENVFVEVGDIMSNTDISTRTKCLYVACSRASKDLTMFI
jgi:ATP-dependent exoDNAse (exonuclease V) alpha subunit